MTLFSYVVRWDHGFAPNPFFNICSLATCKPGIRRTAKLGDYVLGTGTAERKRQGHVVFLMRVTGIMTFDHYWRDPQFAEKIPVMNGSLKQRFGDNIYHRENGGWVQADSRHSAIDGVANENNLHRDTGSTDNILLGSDFTYWGGEGPKLPANLRYFLHPHPSYKKEFSDKQIEELLKWISGLEQTGYVGDPYEWRHEKRWR